MYRLMPVVQKYGYVVKEPNPDYTIRYVPCLRHYPTTLSRLSKGDHHMEKYPTMVERG